MSSLDLGDSYDLIICGGGTAGCVLAARLSSDPDLSILLLEAGPNAREDPRINTPGLFSALFGDKDLDWNFMSEPNDGLYGRKIEHPRGKCLGGSSAMNLMALVYPSKAGLEGWADLIGDESWGWEGMKKYFRKFQTHVLPSEGVREALGIDYLDGDCMGTEGPIKASFPKSVGVLQKAWVETLGRGGSPMDGVGYGGFTVPASVDVENGERSWAGKEYLDLAEGRENLSIVTGAVVEKVVLEKEDGGLRATGVRFSRTGESFEAKANKEVIISAGVFGSPQILELSGIGCKDLCDNFGIENIIDNPNVGENLQDHLMVGPSYEVLPEIPTLDNFRDPSAIAAAMQEYQTSRSGPLAAGGGYSFAYTPLLTLLAELEALLCKHLPASSPPQPKSSKAQQNFIRKIILSPEETPGALCCFAMQLHNHRLTTLSKINLTEPENYVSLACQLSHPFSRGNVHITSPSASDPPKITQNYLSHPLDAEILGRLLLQAEKISTMEPFASCLKKGGKRLPKGQGLGDLGEAIEFARRNASSNYHPCGTCAMMPEELGGVVNERLVVHRTKNLRVVDASVFPIEPRGNIQSCVYATAEKGADLIKEDLQRGSAR